VDTPRRLLQRAAASACQHIAHDGARIHLLSEGCPLEGSGAKCLGVSITDFHCMDDLSIINAALGTISNEESVRANG
jgi:hypothetical protein